jgi:Flp pilus assembly protein TadG
MLSSRRPRHQRGQAIVLIAIMVAVLVGMAALAIDGARAYALRRDLQEAVDAAALAAGDNLQQTGSYVTAERAATSVFASNLSIYPAPACAPGYGNPGALPLTITCTFSDGTVLTQVVSTLGAAGSQFALTGKRSLTLQFARILTNGVSPRLSAAASGGVNNLLYSPALATLNQAGCGGRPGSALSVSGSGSLVVQGDVVSAGAVSVSGGAVQVAGDTYARCQASIASLTSMCYPSGASTPCTFPDVAGAVKSGYRFVDPNYPPPRVTGGSRGAPGIDVILSPGSYNTDPVFNGGACWFLSAGVYQWTGGLTNDGDFISNELKPPAEPLDTDDTRLARRQFWNTNGVNCAGDFRLTALVGSSIIVGTWAIEVTSTRTDTYLGTSYSRESAPSVCRTVNVGAGQAIKVQISNVPGATSYNVYAALPPNGCAGPLGLAGRIAVAGPVQNSNTVPCPDFGNAGCTLGNETAIFDSSILSLGWAPNPFAAPGVIGAYPPDEETAPLGSRQVNQNPDRAAPPRGDRANENQCDTAGGALMTCPGPITPGAVEIYLPAGGCLTDTNNGDNFIFSGYQYNWIAIYEPGAGHPPANTCANLMDASSNSAYVGLDYLPSASLDIPTRVGFRTEATGGIIADTITFSGQLPLIVFSSAYAPSPPAARLVA